MNIGMLWFDNDSKTGLTTKVERAVNYYRNKYGITPTLCFVHPSMLAISPTPPDSSPVEAQEEKVMKAAGVEIRSNRSVMPNHLWIGVNGSLEAQAMGS